MAKAEKNKVNKIEEHIQAYEKGYHHVRFGVNNGCPGPKVFEIGDRLAILALNAQWWNHPYDKPRPTDAMCEGLSQENLKEELEDAVDNYQDRNVLVVGHHRFLSLGNYGGYFSFFDHFTPFPVAGFFKTSFHANVGHGKDVANQYLEPYVGEMLNLFNVHSNLLYASGHEKNQQVIEFGDNYLLNSGAPVKARYAANHQDARISEKAAGVLRLTYHTSGAVEVAFLENTADGFQQKQRELLFQGACGDTVAGLAPVTEAWIPCKKSEQAAKSMARSSPEKTTIAAGAEYDVSGLRRFWFGEHYRTTWSEPVTVPFLDLDTTYGGLTIYKKGGGRQTTSLKFRSENGNVYTLRSVNKNPTKALKYNLRKSLIADIARDQTSTQQPYGAMIVAPLLNKIDLLHASPVLYRLPDDHKLGPFQDKYGGLFDILVGDWNKHEDNWKWAEYETEDGRLFRPIPRDRDHVFSMQDGPLNWLADRPFGLANLENFGENFTGLRNLTFQARHMDRFLMQDIDRAMFIAQVKYIQNNISEADIDAAVGNMPPEVMEKSGKTIARKLKNRIQHLGEAAEEYYAMLVVEVDIRGSEDDEYFEIDRLEDGNLRVRMYDVKRGGKVINCFWNVSLMRMIPRNCGCGAWAATMCLSLAEWMKERK